ncbi:MAG: STAS domain-containing protein [Gammaproteobacteria bacterium]|nr:STAS domain-containing protein [Gammaproteobacteria bacterium]
MLAIIDAYRTGLLKPSNWLPNITAGLVVGVVALPLAMAFAIASGVKPEEGLYTAIVAAVVVAILGGSRVQVAGPTGAFVVILANITAQYGVSGLQIATLLAGIMLLFMGFIRLGGVIKFIPEPVIVGFTAGIGVIIFVGQWKDFLGLTVHYSLNAHFHEKLLALFHALPSLNWATTGLSCLSIALILLTPKILKRIPGPLVAMLVVTTLQYYFQFNQVSTLGSAFGGIPRHLPEFKLLPFTLNEVLDLIGPAFTIALLGAIESLLSASVADGMTGTRHHSNQELIGQGIANILTPLFGGFAATGAIARTATNIRNGGNSPLAAIVHSVLLIAIILFLAPLASYIPLCSLAAILFVVSYNMSDLPYFTHILKRAPHYDKIVLVSTFLLTIFTDLVIAVNVGVILAILFFMRQMIQAVSVKKESSHNLRTAHPEQLEPLSDDMAVYAINGPFFFGVTEKIEHALAITHTDPKTIIFRLENVPFIDMTGLQTFYELLEQYHKRRVKIYLCEVNATINKKLEELHLLKWVEKNRTFPTLKDALKDASPHSS